MAIGSGSSIPQSSKTKLERRFVDCYERGVRLMDCDKNYEYAHMMFAECVLHEPANLKYVDALLRNLRAKFPRPKKKVAILSGGASRALKHAVDGNERSKVFRLGIELLKSDAWDIPTLRLLAQACAHFHYNEVELVYLKQAIDADPKDIETNRHCACSLARMGQFDQAIACWHRIETLRPADKEAPRMITQLSEEKLKYPGGRPPVSTQRAETTPKVVLEDYRVEAFELSLSPRQKLEQAIEKQPAKISNYLELADLLAESDLFQEAKSTLASGIAVCGNRPELLNKLQVIQDLQSKQESAEAEARRRAELRRQRSPLHFPWLESILILAATAFVLQVFPSVAAGTWRLLNFKNWSSVTWLLVNIVVLLLLCLVRFFSEFNRTKQMRVKGHLARTQSRR